MTRSRRSAVGAGGSLPDPDPPTVPLRSRQQPAKTRLRVTAQGEERLCDGVHPRLRFGRGEDNDFTLGDAVASRYHGEIEHRRDRFSLTDTSTNGTLIVCGGVRTLQVHDETVPLEGSGAIHLGRLEGAELRFAVEVLAADGRSWVADQTSTDSTAIEGSLFRREGDYWTVAHEGAVLRLRDSKGLRCIAQLLSHPDREFHALDLGTIGSDPGPEERTAGLGTVEGGGLPASTLSDAGPALDAKAKAAYRRRLVELEEEREEAERFNDLGRAECARDEIAVLRGALAAAVGLGGRDRPTASNAERARVMVTTRIKAAIKRLLQCHPALGHHLSASVKTGRYCSYRPDPTRPVTWIVEP
jgi:FHA domain